MNRVGENSGEFGANTGANRARGLDHHAGTIGAKIRAVVASAAMAVSAPAGNAEAGAGHCHILDKDLKVVIKGGEIVEENYDDSLKIKVVQSNGDSYLCFQVKDGEESHWQANIIPKPRNPAETVITLTQRHLRKCGESDMCNEKK